MKAKRPKQVISRGTFIPELHFHLKKDPQRNSNPSLEIDGRTSCPKEWRARLHSHCCSHPWLTNRRGFEWIVINGAVLEDRGRDRDWQAFLFARKVIKDGSFPRRTVVAVVIITDVSRMHAIGRNRQRNVVYNGNSWNLF